MTFTEEELDAKRQRNQQLRQEIAAQEAARLSAEVENSRVVTAAQLDAETAQLESQLAAAKRAAEATTVNRGGEAPLRSALEAMEQAAAQTAAAEERDRIANEGLPEDHPTSTTDPRLAEPAEDAVTESPVEPEQVEPQPDGGTLVEGGPVEPEPVKLDGEDEQPASTDFGDYTFSTPEVDENAGESTESNGELVTTDQPFGDDSTTDENKEV